MLILNWFRLLGDFVHLMSILILWYKMRTSYSCSGISLKTQLLLACVYIARYLDLFYFPRFDFLHVYNFVMKLFFICSQTAILYMMLVRLKATYDPKLDTFRVEVLVGPCALLALFLTDWKIAGGSLLFMIREYFWTFSILLESVVILPQLFMLQQTGEAETITSTYILCLGLYRTFYLFNWLYRWAMQHPPETISVLAGVLQTALYSDFFYVYYKRVFQGKTFKLPI